MNRRRCKIIAIEGIDGSGKTTLVNKISKYLIEELGYKVSMERLAPEMVEIYKEIVDIPMKKVGQYQSEIPGDFRMASYIFESAIQMRVKMDEYSQYDFLIFDRWMQTNLAYLPKINWHSEYFDKVMSMIPKPDVLIYLDVDVEIAIERLKLKDDWMIKSFNDVELYDKLSLYKQRFENYFEGYSVFRVDANCEKDTMFMKAKQYFSKFL